MSETNKLSDRLVKSVIDANDEMVCKFDKIVDIITDRILECAHFGFTQFLIHITRNHVLMQGDNKKIELILPKDTDQLSISITLFAANDIIKNACIGHIKKYYEKEGLTVSNRHNSNECIIISWNNKVLDHYGL